VARLCPNATTAGRGVAVVRAALVEAAAPAPVEDEEDAAAVEEERYAFGGACRVLAGMPAPLGATALAGGVNFAVYSGDAIAAALCLFTPDDIKAVGLLTSPVPQFSIPCALLFVPRSGLSFVLWGERCRIGSPRRSSLIP
jgi:hypothetical protein